MRNLVEPDRAGDRSILVTALSQYRYRGALCGYAGTAAEIDEVVALYDMYDAARGAATEALVAPAMGTNLKQALHDAYDQTQRKRRLRHVREQLFAGVELCPVCGIEPPIELDHVLPRGVYKALAIYVRNLVPLCHPCNLHKLAGFASPEGIGFIHAYFDLLPDVQFLRAEVELRGAALSVEFSIDDSDAELEGVGERLVNIHKKLELNERYRAEVNLFVAGQAISLHGAYMANGAQGVRTHLLAQARYEVRRFYRNHWRPTLLFSLAGHVAFCEGGFIPVVAVPDNVLRDAFGRN